MVKDAKTALTYYANLKNEKVSYMKDDLIGTGVKGLERDFAKPIRQRTGFTTENVQKLVKHILREKIPKLIDMRMVTLILFLYISASRFEEAAGIEVENVQTIETSKYIC